jgi:hypothetical protein
MKSDRARRTYTLCEVRINIVVAWILGVILGWALTL